MSKTTVAHEEIDFENMTHVTADELQVAAAKSRGPMGISVVNTAKNGTRVSLTKALFEGLGSPKELQLVTDGDSLYIGDKIPHCTQSVPFSKGSGVNKIYNRGLVNYLTQRFKLDFTDCTSLSFRDVEIMTQEYEGGQITFAKICMK
jgi:hypothetical protein